LENWQRDAISVCFARNATFRYMLVGIFCTLDALFCSSYEKNYE
jgi:hypothetical protein